jgi:hypothetical protein
LRANFETEISLSSFYFLTEYSEKGSAVSVNKFGTLPEYSAREAFLYS